ncbi:hypothetical protein ACJMK2_009716 [Sinanodonta woodiana]|uniref:Protein SYS1 homolog n=1 Tax=Sinanodonta woodiana TaxID=1069815 RepID=A0ABD3VD56_SINWO
MPGHFRSNVWDPIHIVAQIVSMQCQYYVTLGFWVTVLDFIVGYDVSIDQLFSQAEKGVFSAGPGKVNTIAYALNCLTSAVGLWFIVQRTKQCLDFSFTVHLIHFFISWGFNGYIPHTASWWILNIIGVTLMTVLGEFLCMRTELKAIPIGLGQKADV